MTPDTPLADLVRQMDGAALSGDGRIPVRGIALDSRRIGPGFLFAALRGDKTDGMSFVGDALARGAVAVVSDRPRPAGIECPWVLAGDAREAVAGFARALYGRPDEKIPVIGITGTNGKTTIAYLLESIVAASGGAAGVIGTVSYRIAGASIPAPRTTPEADVLFELLARMVETGCTHAILEVSSHALALRRVHGLRAAAGIFTNLTRDHLDFHRTMESYFEAKSLLFRSLPASSVAVLNADSPSSARLASLTRARVVTFGISARADYRIGRVFSSFDGVRFELRIPEGGGRSIEVVSPLPGLHNASNVAGALAVALSLGIPAAGALDGVRLCHGAPGRFQTIQRGQDFHVIVDYAHTDNAIASLLDSVRALCPARILTVFGCGGDRDRDKRPLMGAAAARGSDEVILTSDNPRTEDPEKIMDDAEAGLCAVPGAGERYRRIADRREAIAAAIALAQTGDAVVISGKGHETYQILKDRTIPFDDALVAAECIDTRMGR